MKISTKIFLPIILISALLILLAGCLPDDSPGYTPGAISGTIARPEVCCGEPSESYLVGDAISPNVCDVLDLCDPQYMADWYAWANVEVFLTTWVDCEEVEIASTMTDENGEYLFSDVPSGKNYIITAICPEEIDFKVKDVAEEVVDGETYDAGIADAESTVLALCLEGLGEICLDSYLLDLNDFRDHWKYEKVICEVCEKLAECLHALPVWVCEITELCPGYTPTGDDDDDDDECDGNIAPSITSVELNGNPISINDTVNVVVGTPYAITVNATDDGILGSLSYSATVDGTPVGTVVSNVVTVTPLVAGTFEVYVYVNDGCDTTPWGPVTVVICTELEGLSIAIDPVDGTVCDDECATLGPVTISFTDATPDLDINDLTDARLTWDTTPAGISFNTSTGEVCLTGDPNTYTLGVTYEDECGATVHGTVDVTFELCCPPLDTLSIAIDPVDGTVCDDECATLGPVTISFTDATPDLDINDLTDARLTWDTTPAGISFNTSTGEVCLTGDPNTYTLGVTYEDECGATVHGTVDVTFELCCPPLDTLSIAIDPVDGTVCDDECATLGPVTISFTDATPDLDINDLTDARLTWDTTPAGISFNTSTGEVCLTGDPNTYTLGVTYEDECGATVHGTVDVTFELCCPPLDTLSIAIDPVDGTVCDDECATLGPVTISFTDATPDLDINDLTDARLTWDTTPAGISFNTSTGEVCLTGDPNTYTLGVTYEDECGATVHGTVDVTFELCCIDPILDFLEFRVKLPSDGSDFNNWTEMFGYEGNPVFDPYVYVYNIETGLSGSPKFGFKATGCGTLQLKYNWYRGLQCGDSWLEDDGSGEVPPGWRDIDIAGVYPELNSENTLCQHGGNILIIKVIDDDLDEQTYTININRGP